MASDVRPTVLIVDDEADVADAYAAQIEGHYDVRTAYSGADALDALGPAVDVVLLDRRMPDVSGDEVLETIRERGIDARVAMVTAVDPDFEIIDMPFDDYVVKPMVKGDLLSTIERLHNCASYEARMREYFALTSKYATLQALKSDAELAASEEFQALEADIEAHRKQLDDVVSTFDEGDFVAVFRELGSEPIAMDSE